MNPHDQHPEVTEPGSDTFPLPDEEFDRPAVEDIPDEFDCTADGLEFR